MAINYGLVKVTGVRINESVQRYERGTGFEALKQTLTYIRDDQRRFAEVTGRPTYTESYGRCNWRRWLRLQPRHVMTMPVVELDTGNIATVTFSLADVLEINPAEPVAAPEENN